MKNYDKRLENFKTYLLVKYERLNKNLKNSGVSK